MPRIGHALRIQGSGDPSASASDKRFWFCTRALDSDPDGLCIECALDLPREIGFESSLREPATTTGGSVEMTLGGTRATYTAVLAALGRYGKPLTTARLTAEATPSATTLGLDVSGLDGELVYRGLEAIVLGTETGSTGEYTGCTRGVLGTVARHHQAGARLTSYMDVIDGRPVELLRYDLSGSYSDAVVVWWGYLTRRYAQALTLTLQAEPIMRAAEGGQVLRQRFRARAVAGTWQTSMVATSIGSTARPIAGPSGDQRCVLMSSDGFIGLWSFGILPDGTVTLQRQVWGEDTGPWLVRPTLDDKLVVGDEEFVEVLLTDPDVQPLLKEQWTASSMALPQNPIRYIQALLTTTSADTNGGYDLGHGQLGVGLTASAFDTDAWDDVAARFEGYTLRHWLGGYDDGAVDLSEEIKRIFGPLGVGLTMGPNGLRPWTALDAAPYGSTAALGLSEMMGQIPGALDLNAQTAVSEVRTKWGGYLGGIERRINATNALVEDLYPFSPTASIEVDASAYQLGTAAEVAQKLTEEYQTPPAIQDVVVERALLDVYPGDVVPYTHPLTAAPDGTLGLTATAAQVIGRAYMSHDDGGEGMGETLRLALALRGAQLGRNGKITNAMRLSSYTAPGASASGDHELVVTRTEYKAGSSEPLSPDFEPLEVGDTVRLCDEGLVAFDTFTIKSRTAGGSFDTLTVDASHTWASTPAPNDIIRRVLYADATDDERGDWAYWGPATGDTFAAGGAVYVQPIDVNAFAGSAGNLDPDAWVKFGSGLMAEGEPVDEAILERACANARANLQDLLPDIGTQFDVRNPPWLWGGSFKCVALFPIYVSAEDVEGEMGVILEGNTEDVTVYATIVTEDGQAGKFDSRILTSSASGLYEWTIPVAQYEGVVWVGLVALSAEDTASATSAAAPTDWQLNRVTLASDLGLTCDSEVYVVKFTDPSGNLLPQWVPNDRTLLRDNVNGSSYTYHHFPAISLEQLGVASSTGNLRVAYTPIGYLKVYSIHWRVTDTSIALPGLAQYRAGLEPAARTLRRIQAAAEYQLRTRPLIFAAGPVTTQVPALTGGTSVVNTVDDYGLRAGVQVGTVGTELVADGGTIRSLWGCIVGRYDGFTDIDGATEHQTTLVIEGLVGVSDPRQGAPGSTFLRLQAWIDDLDEAGTRPYSDAINLSVPIMRFPSSFSASTAVDSIGWWRTFTRKLTDDALYRMAWHAGRWMQPMTGVADGLRAFGLVPFRIEIGEDASEVSSTQRFLTLNTIPDERVDGGGDLDRFQVYCPGAICYVKRTPIV